jgi:hypothetical protein
VQFETKIAVVLLDELAVWQKTNVTAFLVSGIAGTVPGVVGDPYRDGSGNEYLPSSSSRCSCTRPTVRVFAARTSARSPET